MQNKTSGKCNTVSICQMAKIVWSRSFDWTHASTGKNHIKYYKHEQLLENENIKD